MKVRGQTYRRDKKGVLRRQCAARREHGWEGPWLAEPEAWGGLGRPGAAWRWAGREVRAGSCSPLCLKAAAGTGMSFGLAGGTVGGCGQGRQADQSQKVSPAAGGASTDARAAENS